MQTKLVKGAPVIGLDAGAQLGKIDQVFLDPERQEIVGFSFQSGGGLFGGKTSHIVDVADIHGIGPDAVTLHDAASVRSELAVAAKRDDLIDLEDLLKRKVITENGAILGQVVSIQFGSDTYRLLAIEVAGEHHQPPTTIPAATIQSIGSELIVVAEAVAQGVPDLRLISTAA